MRLQLVSIFYKQHPECRTIEQLLHPEHVKPGDRFTRVFQRTIELSYSSADEVLEELFATFNGHGKPLPSNTALPRSICVGDIMVIDEENGAFVVTATGFENVNFAWRVTSIFAPDANSAVAMTWT